MPRWDRETANASKCNLMISNFCWMVLSGVVQSVSACNAHPKNKNKNNNETNRIDCVDWPVIKIEKKKVLFQLKSRTGIFASSIRSGPKAYNDGLSFRFSFFFFRKFVCVEFNVWRFFFFFLNEMLKHVVFSFRQMWTVYHKIVIVEF